MAKTKRKHYWFLLGLVGSLLAVPNALFVRLAARENFDPFLFNVLRFAAVALVTTPYLVTKLRSIKVAVNIVNPLVKRPWGLWDFRIEDPFGFYLRITEHHDIKDTKYSVPTDFSD